MMYILLEAISFNKFHGFAFIVPKSGPQITLLENDTSTSIKLTWNHIAPIDLNGERLDGYRVFFREKNQDTYTLDQMKAVTPDRNSTIIIGLKKYTDYLLRILASTDNGNGIPSDAVDFKTDEDVPSVSPPNFKVSVVNSTYIVASWDPIDQQFVHGILLGYNMTIVSKRSGDTRKESYGKLQRTADLKDLEKFTKYSVQICGITSKGCGEKAEQIVTTLEDTPSLPPQNPRAVNLTSLSELQISWNPVPTDAINGILLGYKIEYRVYKQTNTRVYESNVFKEYPSQSDTNYKLNVLESFSVYDIKIAANNSKGFGPFATFYGETCRCPKYINTNYWFLTPYLNRTASGQVRGIFSHIVTDMIKWACADCVNGHGKTVVNFDKDGKGSSAAKNSMLDVVGAIDSGHQVSFPMNGNKDMHRIYGGKPFIPMVQSPGIAYLIVPEPPGTPAWNMFQSTIKSLPFIFFSLMLCYLSGVVIWFLDAGSPGSIFPSRFTRGVYEGIWWAFITMTTVGYGDRVPLNKISSRLFAIIWTLYGIVLISLLTSTISNSLTTVSLQTQSQIYGKQIAAIQNSSEHRRGILMNGKVNEAQQYLMLNDILEALVSRQVQGALVDSYVVAAEAKKFADHGIRVAKILDRPFGYGVALSIGMAPLESECREFLKLKAEEIYRLIDQSTEKLTVPSITSASKSTGLFDPSSKLYRNTALFVGCMLCFVIMCGLVWHYTCRRRNTLRVSSEITLKMDESKLDVYKMKRAVQKFRKNFISKINKMRVEHKAERLKIYMRDKEIMKQRRKQEKAERKAEAKIEEFHLTDLMKLVSKQL